MSKADGNSIIYPCIREELIEHAPISQPELDIALTSSENTKNI